MTKGLCERKWNKVAPISKVFGAQDVSGNVLCTVAFLADWHDGACCSVTVG